MSNWFSDAVSKIESFFEGVEEKVKAVNWAEAITYWQDFVAGLEATIPVIESLFPQTKPEIETIVKPIVGTASQSVVSLMGVVQGYSNGTLTAADVAAASQQVNASVQLANQVVGQAHKGKLVTTVKAPVTMPAQG
jgi:hypothetical protein